MSAVKSDIRSDQAARREPDEVACDRNRALIVDDEVEIVCMFRTYLVSAMPDLTVDVAYDGEQAVDRFSRGHHAVLLMDLHMPVMNGSTSVSRINDLCSSRNWERPDIVFCTGFAGTNVRKQLTRDYPGHRLLAKPVRGDTVVNAIKAQLGRQV